MNAVVLLLAAVRMATPFTDGAVLQRDRAVPVWGSAAPGETVTVSFGGQTKRATADAEGAWRVDLDPLKASKEGRELVATGKDGKPVAAKDVLVGEVWMCAGQSNTDCPIWGPRPRYRDGQGSLTISMTVKPWVRLVKVPRLPLDRPAAFTRICWKRMTPEDLAPEPHVARPSAMGYCFALELANALDVPIGLLDASWGGTRIEPWTPQSGFESVEGLESERTWEFLPKEKFVNGFKVKGVGSYHQQPTALWNGMVAPLAPMAIRGMIWYQGCSNAGAPDRYCAKMHALYNGWTKEFANPDLSLYFVQLAPYAYRPGGGDLVGLQLAQAQFAAEEPHAAMAVIGDVGNVWDIHPNDKRTVARRLAAHALKRDYGYDWMEDESPTLRDWKIEDGAFRLTFDHAKQLYVYNMDKSLTTGFEVCGTNGVWRPADVQNFQVTTNRFNKPVSEGTVAGTTLVVAAKDVPEPKKLRYLHSSPWFANLYNEASLPIGPFRIGEDAPGGAAQ